MGRKPETGVARVHRKNTSQLGRTLGTAFLVHQDGLLVTCAHVLEKEPGAADDSAAISLTFHANGATTTAHVLPEFWRPSTAEDIAVLKLDDLGVLSPSVSRGATGAALEIPEVLPLGYSLHLKEQRVSGPLATFGFPSPKTIEGLAGVCRSFGQTKENGFPVFSVISEEVTYGYSGAPIWNDTLNAVVGMNVSIVKPGDATAGRLGKTAFFIPVETVRSVCPRLSLPEGQPYRGLDAFEEKHADFYFGRENATAELVAKLQNSDFVAVIGVSGSGKSSLVRAGLYKGLRAGRNPLADRPRVTCRFGPDSLVILLSAIIETSGELAAEVSQAFDLPVAIPDSGQIVKEALDAQIRKLDASEIAARIRRIVGHTALILVCDQFEKIYTNDVAPAERKKVINTLLGMPSPACKIIITLRADYYGRALDDGPLGTAIRASQMTLLQMTTEELRATIEKPAHALFRYLEPGLSDAIINEVSERAGDLPLLQFALTELWGIDQSKGILTLATYSNMGHRDAQGNVITPGVRGVMVRRAEQVLESERTAGNLDRFRRLFGLLVSRASAVGSTADVSRRVLVSELDPETVNLADKLAGTFLLTAREDDLTHQRTFEVAHEVLLRSWPWLQKRTEQEVRRSAWYDSALRPSFVQWQKHGKSRDFLISSHTVLVEGRQYLDPSYPPLEGEMRKYFELSLAADRFRQLRPLVVIASVLALIVGGIFLLNSEQQRRIVGARDYLLQGVLALQAHENLQAQVYFAKALTLDSRIETRERLIEALASGLRLVNDRQLAGKKVSAISADGAIVVLADQNEAQPLLLASSDGDGKQALWTSQTYPGITLFAAISPDNRWVAWETHLEIKPGEPNPNPVNKLHLLDRQQGTEKSFDSDDKPVSAITFSRRSDLLAFASESGVIHLVDLAQVLERSQWKAHSAAVWSLAISQDNTLLASAGTNAELRLWTLADGKPTPDGKPIQLLGHTDVVYSVAFSPDGRTLATGSADSTVRLWDTASVRTVQSPQSKIISGNQGQPNVLTFSSDGALLLGCCEDRTVRVWDVALASEVHKIPTSTASRLRCVRFTPDGGGFRTGSDDGWLRYCRLDDRTVVTRLRNQGAAVTAAAFSPDEKRLFCTGSDGGVRQWSWPEGKQGANIAAPTQRRALCLAVNPIQSLIAWADEDNQVYLYEYAAGRLTQPIDLKAPKSDDKSFKQIWSVAFSRDGRRLACANWDRKISVFEQEGKNTEFTFLRTLDAESGAVFAVTFGSTSSTLASTGGDKLVRLWQVDSTTNQSFVLGKQNDEVWGLSFNSDATRLASGGEDQKIFLWDVLQRKQIGTFSGHTAAVYSLAFSPRNDWLASGGNDQTTRLWHLSRELAVVLRGQHGSVWSVNFDRAGRFLVTGGLEGVAYVWEMDNVDHLITSDPTALLNECLSRTGATANPDGSFTFSTSK
jgi:WD40 repeat protein